MTDSQGRNGGAFERAAGHLRESILAGDINPDQHLVEMDLAESLKVSRTTVRAALLALAKEGFVTMEPNRGARVRSFTIDEAREVLVLRDRLEGVAASLAAENTTPSILDRFEEIIENMTIAHSGDDAHLYRILSSQFHALVTETARNETLARLIDQTRYQLVVRQFWGLDSSHPRRESLNEHKAILVALRGKDAVAAERMMRLHAASVRAALDLELPRTLTRD